jgi:hypothetical protein
MEKAQNRTPFDQGCSNPNTTGAASIKDSGKALPTVALTDMALMFGFSRVSHHQPLASDGVLPGAATVFSPRFWCQTKDHLIICQDRLGTSVRKTCNTCPIRAAYMQDLASFLLVRGRYAWLGYGWQGCTNGDTHSASGSGYGKWGTEMDEDYGEPLVREKTAAFSGFPCVFVPSLSWQIILFIWNVLRHSLFWFVLRKTAFLRHLFIKTNILPRQARDKHRGNSKKRCRFPHQERCHETSPGSEVFERKWSKATVQLDCKAWKGTIQMADGRLLEWVALLIDTR